MGRPKANSARAAREGKARGGRLDQARGKNSAQLGPREENGEAGLLGQRAKSQGREKELKENLFPFYEVVFKSIFK
jgi:hypothetical protein